MIHAYFCVALSEQVTHIYLISFVKLLLETSESHDSRKTSIRALRCGWLTLTRYQNVGAPSCRFERIELDSRPYNTRAIAVHSSTGSYSPYCTLVLYNEYFTLLPVSRSHWSQGHTVALLVLWKALCLSLFLSLSPFLSFPLVSVDTCNEANAHISIQRGQHTGNITDDRGEHCTKGSLRKRRCGCCCCSCRSRCCRCCCCCCFSS